MPLLPVKKTMTLSSPLVQAFHDHPLGLCGQGEPAHVIRRLEDIEQRLNLLAFGVVMDVKPIDAERWSTLAEFHDHWLFAPSQAAYKTSPQIFEAMQQIRLGTPRYIARVWWQISRGVQGRTKGSWLALIEANQGDALQLRNYLQNNKATFPVLSGPVLSMRWLDMAHRAGGVELKGWESLRVPVPNEIKTQAGLFGIAEEAHPAFIRALQVWKQACQKGQNIPCGLTNCPHSQLK